jgi:hypothetical protein
MIRLLLILKSPEVSRLLRDPRRREGGERDRAEEVLPKACAAVPPGQEQSAGSGGGLQGHRQRFRRESRQKSLTCLSPVVDFRDHFLARLFAPKILRQK